MAAEQYHSAQLVFGWSFYRQGTSGGSSSADEFLDAALHWFGDPDSRLGTAWEKRPGPPLTLPRARESAFLRLCLAFHPCLHRIASRHRLRKYKSLLQGPNPMIHRLGPKAENQI